jgi:hypothetical protein
MKKDTKEQLAKESIFNDSNPIIQKRKALLALKKAKELDANKIAAGKKMVRIDHRTQVLR